MGRLSHRTAPACTYFVTTKTWQNRALFNVPQVAEIALQRLLACRDRGAYLLHEFVIMPDHLHVLLTPSDTTTLEKAMQLIKGGSSHEIHRAGGHKMQVWQPGFHDWTIRDFEDYQAKREYIHMNPTRAGLVQRPADWPYSSVACKANLDPMPERLALTSGAQAPPLPHHPFVGAKAPTPGGIGTRSPGGIGTRSPGGIGTPTSSRLETPAARGAEAPTRGEPKFRPPEIDA